jgi:hypothetical protein
MNSKLSETPIGEKFEIESKVDEKGLSLCIIQRQDQHTQTKT